MHARPCAAIAAASLGGFVAAAVAMHLLRPELGLVASQMSLYLIGPWGHLLQAAYVVLGVGMVVLAWGLNAALAPPARSAAPLLLVVLAALCLSTTAFAWMDMPGAGHSLQGLVHGLSAQGAFLFATTATVLMALRMRRDVRWHGAARVLLPWALACFVAVWVLALWHSAPRGLAQKSVIALIVGWLASACACLWHSAHAEAPAGLAQSACRSN